MNPVDVQGKTFEVGQKVARGYSVGRGGSAAVQIVTVTSIRDGKVYLDNSPQAIKFPERLAIIS